MKIVLTRTEENIRSIYNEVFGEKTDHPLLARVLAFIVDYLMFIASGPIIYLGLNAINRHTTLAQLLIHITLWIIYFTLGNSRVFKGQTIGKKLLRIRVVDNQGEYLGLIKSFVRSLPVVLLMNGYQIMYFIITEQNDLYTLGFYLLTTILFGTIYFVLLNLNRQALHDLLVYSQVVPRDRNIIIANKINWGLTIGFVAIVTMYVIFMLNWSE
jgi:uncharacterized RDD family membrane protein YckC